MKRVFKLIFISFLFKKLIGLVFFIHGNYMAIKRWELLKYWEEVAIINDVWLNVIGKYSIHQASSHEQVFGNRLMTISAAMYEARLHKFGKWCEAFVNKRDPGHFRVAHQMHYYKITNEYIRLKALKKQNDDKNIKLN